jgi:hypothetical protein
LEARDPLRSPLTRSPLDDTQTSRYIKAMHGEARLSSGFEELHFP